ncbi:MAG TPA: ABC transporter permease [Acidimicrobiales bacterium]|nr:ABC transporter permease [Acidimicrobiales bacterium]
MSASLSAEGASLAAQGRRPGDLARSWLRIRAIARRHAYVLLRSPHRLFDVTIWPLVDVLLFGSLGVFVSRQAGAGPIAFAYLLSGIVLWHVVYQSQIALSTGLLEETWSRNLLNLMVTPLTEAEYVLGVMLFGMVKLAIGVGVVAFTALGFYAFNVTNLGWEVLPVAAILLTVGWVIALFVIGFVLRFGSGAEALAWGILFMVMPLSGVFYPVKALPAVLRPIAEALPTTHAFAAGRALLVHRGLAWGQVGIAAASTVALLAVAFVFVTAMLGLFRRRGYITRYS